MSRTRQHNYKLQDSCCPVWDVQPTCYNVVSLAYYVCYLECKLFVHYTITVIITITSL